MNAKKLFWLGGLALIFFNAAGQSKHQPAASVQQNLNRCGTHEKMMELKALDPDFDMKQAVQEQLLQNWITNHYPQWSSQRVILTIPVVVQLWVNTSTVSDARVQEQINVLNADYRRLNSDTTSTPSTFKAVAADCEIEFCLATIDPQGNATTGIVRKTVGGTPTGSDLWTPSQYLNLLVYDLGGGLLGFTYLPSQSPNQGVHIGYQYFGKTGASAPYNKGRTATHEVGHWFNLEHTWGDANCGTDYINDTPTQQDETTGCPSYPNATGCSSPTPPGRMFQNYLDYSNDNCMNIFTADQKARMIAAINQYRSGLLNNGKCGSIVTVDAGIQTAVQPVGTLCSTTFTPVVVLKNFGSVTLTSCTISYYVDANSPNTYNWTGTLATSATVNVTLPSITVTSGSHTFTAVTSNPNGASDANSANDPSTGSFNVSTIGQSLPFSQGFENTTFAPTGWTLTNPDGSITWVRTTTAAKTGSASMFMNNYNYNASGQVDEITTPSLNLASLTNPTLTFQVAYRLYTNPTSNPNYSDTLKVRVSNDCGVTWTTIYNNYGTTLTTATPNYSGSSFVPTSTQWRMETISLSSYASFSNALIKFRHTSDYENNMYVDDINITGVTSYRELAAAERAFILPNPINDRAILYVTPEWLSSGKSPVLKIFSILGKEVKIVMLKERYTPIEKGELAPGIYFYMITAENQFPATGKLVVE